MVSVTIAVLFICAMSPLLRIKHSRSKVAFPAFGTVVTVESQGRYPGVPIACFRSTSSHALAYRRSLET